MLEPSYEMQTKSMDLQSIIKGNTVLNKEMTVVYAGSLHCRRDNAFRCFHSCLVDYKLSVGLFPHTGWSSWKLQKLDLILKLFGKVQTKLTFHFLLCACGFTIGNLFIGTD